MMEIEQIVKRHVVRIVESQDEAIMIVIKKIAGEEYKDITIDKQKTIDALRKATPANFVPVVDNSIALAGFCPTCGGTVEVEKTAQRMVHGVCCSWCGQRLKVKNWIDD